MRVLVIGGYGAFGARIVKRLKRIPSLEVLTGGRNSARADVVMDVKKGESLVQLFQELRPHVVIHTAGPFDLSEDYAVAKACLMASNAGHKCNYLDLADNVDYVLGFGKLDEEAKKKGCVLVTGVSTTPAITTSVVSQYCPSIFKSSSISSTRVSQQNTSFPRSPMTQFDEIYDLDINLSVANSSMPGEGTVRSVLSYCGSEIPSIQDGKECKVFGWKSLTSKRFPGMTADRLCSDVAVPDVDIFTSHVTPHHRSMNDSEVVSPALNALKNFRFRAGVESTLSMVGLSIFATMRVKGFFPSSFSLISLTEPLLKLNKALNYFSSSKGQGGMIVDIIGRESSEGEIGVRWGLSANANTGPEIPCTPAVVLTSKFLHLYRYRKAQVRASDFLESSLQPGARTCIDMVSISEFTDAVQRDDLDIQQYISYCENKASEDVEPFSKVFNWNQLSPTFTALDYLSQQKLPDGVSMVHAGGGVVTGELLVSMSRNPFVRISSKLVGLPIPGLFRTERPYKFIVNMRKEEWIRLSTPADGQVKKSKILDIFSSTFSSNSHDHLLVESIMGGLVQYSMQQKAVTLLRDRQTHKPLGDRTWVYSGFEGTCVRANLFGFIPLPSWFAPIPHCVSYPHEDGLGWNLEVGLSLPVFGEVVRYEGPLRIANLRVDEHQNGLMMTAQKQLQATIRNIYGIESTSIFEKIVGKYLLIYDSECVICDSSVDSLIEKDVKNLIMFSSMHDSKSQKVLSELGVDEKTFMEQRDQTIFLITPFGDILTRSDALLALIDILPGVQYSAINSLLRIVPRSARNLIYDYVARNRNSLLGKARDDTGDTCTILSSRKPSERARFL